MVWKSPILRLDNGNMSDTKEKVNLLDVVPVQCGHITTEWEGECAVLSFPRFKYEWMRRFLLPKGMSADIHVKLDRLCYPENRSKHK